MNPNNRQIRDSRNTKAREKVAMELRRACKLQWDVPVSFIDLEHIENVFSCKFLVFNLNDIPILRSSINIQRSLVFKSESKYEKNIFYYMMI